MKRCRIRSMNLYKPFRTKGSEDRVKIGPKIKERLFNLNFESNI